MKSGADGNSGQIVPITSLGISRTYREALDLAVRAKWLLITQRARAGVERVSDARSPEELGDRVAVQTTYAAETMRMSSRIMHVVAWTMNRKALEAGEIDEAEANTPERRLGGQGVCLGGPVGAIELLPTPIQELWEESERLYRRAVHLERMIEASHDEGARARPTPHPLESLASHFGLAGNDDAPSGGVKAFARDEDDGDEPFA